jgi:hypothetical protein
VDSVFTPVCGQLLHLWWELRLHMCTGLSFSLLNTKLQGLILSPVLSYLYNCVWFKDDNHFVRKSLKLETIMICLLYINWLCYVIYLKEETPECVCLRDRSHNSSFDSGINKDISSSFLVYTSKLVQFEEEYRSMVTYINVGY